MLEDIIYNKVERKVRLIKYEQWKASGQNSRLRHIIEIYLFLPNQKVLSIFANQMAFWILINNNSIFSQFSQQQSSSAVWPTLNMFLGFYGSLH